MGLLDLISNESSLFQGLRIFNHHYILHVWYMKDSNQHPFCWSNEESQGGEYNDTTLEWNTAA